MLHEEVTKDIIGAAMAVLNELKPGLDEKLYENALVIELRARGHVVKQQREYPVHYRGQFIGKLIPDLIVDGTVITDPKVVTAFNDTHVAQMLGYLARHHALDRAQKKRLKSSTFFGIELVDSVTRLCAMNLLLHGIGGELEEDLPVVTKDALAGKHGEYEIVLANPPFGKKSSVTIVNEAGESSKESLIINRDDFWASTSNEQLNSLQHIFTILKQHGRAAVVLPDNVLFEGGAGETIRRELLKQADVHTLLRLPTGIFYAQGVKANVLFFDRKPAQEKPWTQKLWIYDLRTNLHFTLKENTLKRSDLDDFVGCYFGQPGSTPHPGPLPGRGGEGGGKGAASRHNRVETERFKSFTYEELTKRDKVNLDIFWLKDESLEESANLPAPEIIAADITADLEAAVEQFATIAEDLKK
jgi:type I restriction enzyme M protein